MSRSPADSICLEGPCFVARAQVYREWRDAEAEVDRLAKVIESMVEQSKKPCVRDGCTCVTNIGQIALAEYEERSR